MNITIEPSTKASYIYYMYRENEEFSSYHNEFKLSFSRAGRYVNECLPVFFVIRRSLIAC